MPRETAPQEITDLADARAVARRARDWAAADALLVRIAASGWKVIDTGTLYDLVRAEPETVEADGRVLYGSSAAVPSRLDEPAAGPASVVLIATDWPLDLDRAVRSFRATSPAGTQLVVVANAPSADQAAVLEALAAEAGAEVVWTTTRLGHAAALNAGIRRAAGPVVVVADTGIEPQGDLVGALVAALDDPEVAVAGPAGIVSEDLRHFEDAPATLVDVDAIEGYAQAFRRSDYAARGPLDEHFVFYRNLDIWWSLVLRDQFEDEDAPDDALPRRARRVTSVPVILHEHRGWSSLPAGERDRRSKKNFYRVLKRFATRRDLLVHEPD